MEKGRSIQPGCKHRYHLPWNISPRKSWLTALLVFDPIFHWSIWAWDSWIFRTGHLWLLGDFCIFLRVLWKVFLVSEYALIMDRMGLPSSSLTMIHCGYTCVWKRTILRVLSWQGTGSQWWIWRVFVPMEGLLTTMLLTFSSSWGRWPRLCRCLRLSFRLGLLWVSLRDGDNCWCNSCHNRSTQYVEGK
jgi:hypothetical protein